MKSRILPATQLIMLAQEACLTGSCPRCTRPAPGVPPLPLSAPEPGSLSAPPPRPQVRQLSRLYESAPAYVTDQPPFLNAAALVETALPPLELLRSLKDIEVGPSLRRVDADRRTATAGHICTPSPAGRGRMRAGATAPGNAGKHGCTRRHRTLLLAACRHGLDVT